MGHLGLSRDTFIIIIIIIIIITAIQFSPGGSSPYASTDRTNNNEIYINETIQKHSTNNTQHSNYKYTYYQNTHTVVKTPHHIHSPTHYKPSSNNHSTRYTPNKKVTIQSRTHSIRLLYRPRCTDFLKMWKYISIFFLRWIKKKYVSNFYEIFLFIIKSPQFFTVLFV